MYRRYYKEHIYKWAQNICKIAVGVYVVENISLVTLSFWTSDENYSTYTRCHCLTYLWNIQIIRIFILGFHKFSFITFLITSFIHMQMGYFIMRNCRNITKESSETTSLKWKRRSMILNVFSIIVACYFFYRHNKYCEPLGKLID